jgi:cell division septation protein DedD
MVDYSRSRRDTDDSDSFFCRFTFGQFFALLVLEVFTLFFVFYLGARYGREFLGLDTKSQVAVVGTQTSKTTPTVATTDDPEAKEMAKEIIEKAQTPELKERIAEMLNKDAPPANVAAVESAPVQTQTPESKPMPMRPPAPEERGESMIRVKSAENAKYSIQVGSYQQISEAHQKVDFWRKRGYPAYMMIADIPNRGRWYRVRLGGFASRNDASNYLRNLKQEEGVQDALIVLNEQ